MPLPDLVARQSLIDYKLKDTKCYLTKGDMKKILAMTEGYSCSDITAFIKEVAMAPVRKLTTNQLMNL